ncbi:MULTISPECIES: HpcH/HpaI aldolase/citrate lyase family protein [Actinoplanes]|uniref:HpcH/HpaI aldolase/citrate lyase family protein n=1 Tax=Actinoplanes TaxID=1865 RepID=UPI0005F2E858|nr:MULTISPECIES: HpcH/HpaI aldolase/citrate lyase family protein [Actinoplanes]GLY07707.1 ATP/GTP-binding protein [Actinoplanes sp. NBRC 101535]
MRHFAHLAPEIRGRLFSREPGSFDRSADPETLSVALGATLYMPGTRPDLARDLRSAAARGVMSVVVCLEDAIDDDSVAAAQENVITQLRTLTAAETPLTFVRVRHPDQITAIVGRLDAASTPLTGFVLPKFTDVDGADYLDALAGAADTSGLRLFGMPVLESTAVAHRETRDDTLHAVQRLLGKYPGMVLAIRVGATDLCGVYGLRRERDLTVYDVCVVADVIGDIVNVFARADGTGYAVSGPVWEYFGDAGRLFKPQLRESPFHPHYASDLRRDLLASGLDGLLREVTLDKANGLTGKTVIHPSHVPVVHALMVVTAEEFADADDLLATGAHGGVCASAYRNKMNEARPHRAWAERVLRRAAVFGVAREGVGAVDLLVAGAAA